MKVTKKYNMSRAFLLTVLIALLKGMPAGGQEMQMRIVTHPEEVHIYHTKRLSAGHGFNVSRRDSPGEEFRLLTDEPVTRVRNSGELQSRLGSRFTEVMEFFEAESAGELWLFLQGRHFETMMAVSLFPELASAMGMLYVDDSAPVGSEVTYRLEFVDMLGNTRDEPALRQVRLDPRIPSPPSRLRAVNDRARVTLHWHYPRVEREDDDKVIRFFVYRIDQQTGRPELVSDEILIRNNAYDEHLFHFISSVVNVTEQYFVTAADITGQQSEPSEVLSFEIIDIVVPAAVIDVRVIETPGNYAEVTWTMPDDTDITGYHIYRTDDLSVPFRQITPEPLPVDELIYVDSEVRGGRVYFYHVTAVDADGYESEPGALAMVRIRDVTPPPPPDNLTAEFDIETETVALNWGIREITPDLKSFIVLRRREDSRDQGGFSRVNYTDLRETSFMDAGAGGEGFQEGGRYRYVVYSSDHAENYSDTVSVVIEIPLFTPPDPPTGLLAVNDRGIRINLNWNASPSLTTEEYIIHRSSPDNPLMAQLTRVPASARFYRDEEVEPGNIYVYALTAVDRAGNESEYSNTDTLFFRSSTPPRSVRNLQAIERNGGVYMRWERVPDNDLTGYRVYRSDAPSGVYELLNRDLLRETEFFDSEGSADHWYRVRAVDESGNESRPGPSVRPANSAENR